jgi:Glycosyl hydrolase family 63 C-terminal domain
VFAIDEGRDLEFLSRVFDKLLINFAWWVNLEDAGGRNVFEGGFLGLDNIGPLDRSHLPVGGILEQSDATGWMGFYAIALCTISAVLNQTRQRPAADLILKFVEHFAAIRDALTSQGLWDETDGMFYDRLITPAGTQVPVKVRSMVSMIPGIAAAVIDEEDVHRALIVGKQFADLLDREGLTDTAAMQERGMLTGAPGERKLLLSLAGTGKLERLLTRLFDESEFLSPHGLRALSAYHRDHPYQIQVEGITASIDYEPAESTTPLFGGNSNWRGPVWFPLNYLMINALERYHRFLGDDFTMEYPTGSGNRLTLDKIAADLQDRLISLFTRDSDGRRACFGGTELMQHDPAWRDNLIFAEYFHGDNGAALGASHQTGWTGLIADVIRRRHGQVRAVGEIIRLVDQDARM